MMLMVLWWMKKIWRKAVSFETVDESKDETNVSEDIDYKYKYFLRAEKYFKCCDK